jgi:hypothetical protein
MVEETSSDMTFTVADPTQKLKQLKLSVNIHLFGTNCLANGNLTQVMFNLPKGNFAGQTMSQTCTKLK